MAFHSSSIELSSETKKGFGRWLIFALLVVAAAFFLGSWVESRLDNSIRRHDALVAAAVEQAAPEALPSNPMMTMPLPKGKLCSLPSAIRHKSSIPAPGGFLLPLCCLSCC